MVVMVGAREQARPAGRTRLRKTKDPMNWNETKNGMAANGEPQSPASSVHPDESCGRVEHACITADQLSPVTLWQGPGGHTRHSFPNGRQWCAGRGAGCEGGICASEIGTVLILLLPPRCGVGGVATGMDAFELILCN